MLPVGAPRLACFVQTSLVLPLAIFPRRGIREAPLRVRCNSGTAWHHNAAPAAFRLLSGLKNCSAHIRVSTAVQPAGPSLHFLRNRKRPSALLLRCSPPCSPSHVLELIEHQVEFLSDVSFDLIRASALAGGACVAA
ncbi:hypothetical protein NDU88_002359 [Pleurodeles waltl]|uniref:Secreted protein n=1 Tax=Pleurodeles waltl TaxID=8319 RepID=A0AAV7M3P7_PLEWA|nr:hypothetical protein NDU88_002359 [Pleurodeles waltl]